MRPLLRCIVASLLALPAAALAARLEIPLRVPFEPVRQALNAQLAASPSRPGEVFRDGPCRYLNLDAPKLDKRENQLSLVGPGSAAVGIELGGSCRTASDWAGSVDFTLVPRIDEAGKLRVRIVDSSLNGRDGRKLPAAGMVWDLSKRYLHPRLERFSYDIGASRTALLSVIRTAAPPAHAAAMERVVRELQVLEPRVEANHIVVPLALEVPDAWLNAPPPAPVAAAAPLTEAEIEALEKALEPWDAFLVHSIRQIALDSENVELRKRLFTLLLDSRYSLIALLSEDAPRGVDPLRTLFLETWNELRTLLGEAQGSGALDASLLRYAIFIDSGDALLALEKGAPGLGMRPSVDGLRSLARSLRPGAQGDPLAYDLAVDLQLRQLFGVQPPPEDAAPKTSRLLDFLIRSAHAQEQKLDRWLPTKDELPAYEKKVNEILQKTAGDELQRTALAAPYDKVYRNLVPTTALIESCWKQYVSKGGKVTYLRSSAGSVGIMQINQHVWRGFYDIERVRWDAAYNIKAGAQIVMRYIKDYAIPYAEKTGDPNHVPRATYAVYNAGPRAVGRFNKAKLHPREKRVDDKLLALYQGIASGARADLASCGVATGTSH